MTSEITPGIRTRNCELKSITKEKDETSLINREFEKITQIDEDEEEHVFEEKGKSQKKQRKNFNKPFKNKTNLNK